MAAAQPTSAFNNISSSGAREDWKYGLFDCCCPVGTCCMAVWCPCILFGKTKTRTKNNLDPSGWNKECGLFGILMCIGGCQFILQWINRGNTRAKYGIKGNSCGDFCTSCCCGCCALIQEEKESIVRVRGKDPKSGGKYSSPQMMSYA